MTWRSITEPEKILCHSICKFISYTHKLDKEIVDNLISIQTKKGPITYTKDVLELMNKGIIFYSGYEVVPYDPDTYDPYTYQIKMLDTLVKIEKLPETLEILKTDEEKNFYESMKKWLTARRTFTNETLLPSEIDILKSALFERLLSGLDPLEFPPPTGYSCPWYAVVEDPGPHNVDAYFSDITNWYKNSVSVLQTAYRIVGKIDNIYILKYLHYPYRFKLWKNSENLDSRFRGCWLIQNLHLQDKCKFSPKVDLGKVSELEKIKWEAWNHNSDLFDEKNDNDVDCGLSSG